MTKTKTITDNLNKHLQGFLLCPTLLRDPLIKSSEVSLCPKNLFARRKFIKQVSRRPLCNYSLTIRKQKEMVEIIDWKHPYS